MRNRDYDHMVCTWSEAGLCARDVGRHRDSLLRSHERQSQPSWSPRISSFLRLQQRRLQPAAQLFGSRNAGTLQRSFPTLRCEASAQTFCCNRDRETRNEAMVHLQRLFSEPHSYRVFARVRLCGRRLVELPNATPPTGPNFKSLTFLYPWRPGRS
jgi:hypothetical protein